jgi:hypothetical protein
VVPATCKVRVAGLRAGGRTARRSSRGWLVGVEDVHAVELAVGVELGGLLGPSVGREPMAKLSGTSAFGGSYSANVNLVASLGNDDHAITRRGCRAPGSE